MSTTNQRWFHPRGTLRREQWETVVDESTPDWRHTGIRVAHLRPADSLALTETDIERIFVPLAGAFTVSYFDGPETHTVRLAGRRSVFDGPTDILYVPTGASAVVTGEGRIAVATAPTTTKKPARHIPAAGTPVELRGAGRSSRQVHNFGTPAALDADKLIVCEVITPAENWSSYPPHKHDEAVPGHESELEEIYYFETAPTRGASVRDADAAFGMFSTYSSPAGDIDINAMVHTGDVALVPYGYHGPAVAAPGYDLYYLNVMAGPGDERTWLISDDPAHAWIRDTWADQDFDGRLPYTSDTEEGRH